MKNILFIPWTFSNGGGSEKVLFNLISSLSKHGYKVSVLELEKGIHNDYINSKKFNYLGYIFKSKVLDNSIQYKFYRKYIFFIMKNFPKYFIKKYSLNKFDISISFNYLYPSFIISNINSKKICWFHGSIEDLNFNNLNRFNKFKVKQLYTKQLNALNSCNYIVSISARTTKSLIDLYPQFSNKIIEINNGYDFEDIILKSKSFSIDNFDIVSIGRLDKNKNFKLLIEAISILKKSLPNIRVKILGDGPEKSNLINLIKDLGLEDNIQLIGYVKNPYPYIKSAKIMTLTSLSEGFPTVLVESLALGVPFISTNVGGVSELSNNSRCGIIINTSNELANSIYSLLSDDKTLSEFKNNCIPFVKKYSLDTQFDKVNSILIK